MTPPLISAVIPSYNYGHFVVSAVESALAQTYPNVEIIVVDDGSTDDTRQRLVPYLDRIRYLHQTNGGLSAARNTGIRAAAGTWIALLDADDVWHPRKLELQMRCLEAQPTKIGLLGADYFSNQRPDWPDVGNASLAIESYTLKDMLGLFHFAPSSALIRKACLEEAGLFDAALRSVEDRDMWIRLARRCTLAKLPLPLLFYRVHAAGLSNKCAQMERYERQVLDKAFAQMPELHGSWRLRRQTYSQAAFNSAQVFRMNGHQGVALRRMWSSFCLWPLPLPLAAEDRSLVRVRVVLNLLLRMLKLRQPEAALVARPVSNPPPLPLPESTFAAAVTTPAPALTHHSLLREILTS